MIAKQLSFLVVGGLIFIAANFTERKFFPVVEDFSVYSVDVYGPNIVVSGYLNKVRTCVLVQDIQAFTLEGERLEVDFLDRKEGTTTRPAIQGAAQQFGPWIIKGGAGEEVSLYALHRCHALWDQETKLVTIKDAS